MSYLNYFTKMYDYAKIVEDRTGIHAPLILAFWSWESGYGTSPSSQPGQNNHGGISQNSLGNEIVNPDWRYAGYYSIEAFAKDYANLFANNSKYTPVMEANKNNYKAVTQALNSTPYAETKYNVDDILSIAKNATKTLIDAGTIKGTTYPESAYSTNNSSSKQSGSSTNNVTTSNVIIKNIIKNNNKYKFTIAMYFDTVTTSIEVESGIVGDVLSRAITTLNIDNGASFPASLNTLKGVITHHRSNYMKIDIDTEQLEIVNQYVEYTKGKDIEKIISKSSDYILVQDKKPKDLDNTSYIIGDVTRVVDGDTISINVIYANKVDFPVGYNANQKVITIRLSGVQCLETKKDDGKAEETNTRWLMEKGLYSSPTKDQYLEKTYEVANEAKEFVRNEIENRQVFILIDNHPENTQDQYGRLIGVVYIDIPNESNLYDSININRSLLANESRALPGYALGNYYTFVDSTGEVLSKFAQNYAKDIFRKDPLATQKDKNIKTSLETFLENHDLRLDKDGYLVYNEDRLLHFETKVYHVENNSSVNLDDIVEMFRDGEFYTTKETIASFNQYGKDIDKLEEDLKNNLLANQDLWIPIYRNERAGSKDSAYKKYIPNRNIIPADSEFEDYANPLSDDRDLLDGFKRSSYSVEEIDKIYDNGFTRIGDCTFVIPPLSIRVDTLSNSSKIKALRSKSSIQTQTGHSTKIITMELFFSDEEQINGYLVDDPDLNPLINAPIDVQQKWYRNGLRPLIAQFKRAPFLPIENKLLNDSFGIIAVGMKDLQLTTVPGFPGVIQATLTMYEFDHSSYIIGEEDFAGMFNWKLFRWYYQQTLQEKNFLKGKTYLESINLLDDSIHFYILNEEQLAQRQEAIRTLDKMIEPTLYATVNTDEDTENYKRINDAEEMKQAKLQKSIFDEWLSRHSNKDYPAMYDQEGIFIGIDSTKVESKEIDKYKSILLELVSVLYFGGKKLTTLVKDTTRGAGAYTNVFGEYKNYYFIPNNIDSIRNFIKDESSGNTINFIYNNVTYGKDAYHRRDYNQAQHTKYNIHYESDASGGFYMVRLTAAENIMLLNKESHLSQDLYYISPSIELIVADKIANGKDDIQANIDAYQEEYTSLKERTRLDEYTVRQEQFHIGGDYWIESMSAIMNNDLVPLQTYGTESSTFQFLGSQDAQVNLTIRTTSKETVRGFRDLMSTVQRLAREYRVGITSGVLSIKSNLIGLIGSRDHLIQNISVETLQDDKESYRISISLIAFDRTQSAQEKLDSDGIGQFINEDNIGEYSKQRAVDDEFEYAAIDFKLRDIEVYPDLELPTYDELNQMLPYMKLRYYDGAPFSALSNPTGGKYIDPDFYIRTEITERELIYQSLTEDTPGIYFSDSSGFEAIEKGPSPEQKSMSGPNVQLSEGTKSWIENNLSEVYMGSYTTDTSSSETKGIFADFNSSRLTHESADDYDYEDYLYKAKNATTRASTQDNVVSTVNMDYDDITNFLSNPLTDSDYLMLFEDGASSRLDLIKRKIEGYKKNIKNPEPHTVKLTIDSLVSIYFSELPYDEKINKGQGVQIDTYTYGPNKISAPIITQQKVSNILKSLFEELSGWVHLDPTEGYPIPIIDSYGNIGIGGLNINSGVLKDKDDIKKCAYLWNYALSKSIQYFAWCYNKAIDSSHINKDASDNPLDWAIVLYKDGKGSIESEAKNILAKDVSEIQFYNLVINRLTTRYGYGSSSRYATPESLMDENLIDYKEERERITDIYNLLYLQLRNSNSLDSSDPKDMKKIEKAIGESVGMNINIMKSIKAIPVINPKLSAQYGDISSNVYITRSGSFKDLTIENEDKSYKIESKNYIAALAIDPDDEFEKSFNYEKALIKWKENMVWPNWGKVEESELFLTIAAQLEHRFMDVQYLSEMEKTHKSNADISQYEAFDFTQNVIVIQKGAAQYIRDMYSSATVNEELYNQRDFSVYSIDWDRVYKVIPLNPVTIEEKEAYKEVISEVAEAEAIAPFIRKADEITDSYRTSFDDLLSHSQKGRLLRAFPTFQMFLIDEGRWMLYHKLWDNFYGYNSVISIDVMKDRRMVADTAVIQLSNIYHNLNTEDEETSWGKFDNNLLDLFTGTQREREKVRKNLFRLPDDEIIRARAEKINSLILKPGARLHLRMGYGANAFALPIMFNGVITEMDPQEIVTIVAQSDGLELTNKMADKKPDDTTDPGILSITQEPREVMGQILTSRGGFFSNVFNKITGGVFFNTHPYGIVHFGNVEVPLTLVVPGIVNPFLGEDHKRWGEAGLNIYSANGLNTFSQWIYTEGPQKGQRIGFDWGKNWFKGDEPNIEIYLFDKTPWDIFQIYAAVCTDYIATVHPFEYRSTIFFGKPHWGIMDHYMYQYKWEADKGYLSRIPVGGYRKSFSQVKMYDSERDIIYNGITASATHMYTNVSAVYNERDGAKTTQIVQVDSDIYPQFQRTALVHVPIKSGINQEKYAQSAATSALRDYVKEMYQGELIVIGDPTVKPYDKVSLNDSFTDMKGLFEVKRVVHSFSHETGYVTSVSPDCISVIDDAQAMSLNTWISSACIGVAATIAGHAVASKLWKSMMNTTFVEGLRRYGSSGVDIIFSKMINHGLERAYKDADSVNVMVRYMKTLDDEALKAILGNKEAMAKVTKIEDIKVLYKNVIDDAKSQILNIRKTGGLNNYEAKEAISRLYDSYNDTIRRINKAPDINRKTIEELQNLSKTNLDEWKKLINKAGTGEVDSKTLKAMLKGNSSDLNSLLKGSSFRYTHLSDEIGGAVHKTVEWFKPVYRNQKTATQAVNEIADKLRKTSKMADKTDELVKAGLIKKTWNFSKGAGAKIGKAGAIAATGITAKGMRGIAMVVNNPIVKAIGVWNIVGDIAITIVANNLIERYQRFLKSRQALTIMPLNYRGKEFIAGLDGHAGSVVGDVPSAVDKFLEGTGFGAPVMSVFNALIGVEIDYTPDNEIKYD